MTYQCALRQRRHYRICKWAILDTGGMKLLVTLNVLKLICKQLVSQELYELGHEAFRYKPPTADFISRHIINKISESMAIIKCDF